jgi:hypothetical protein
MYKLFNQVKEPLSFPLLVFIRWEALRMTRRIIDHLRKDYSTCRRLRSARPPLMQVPRVPLQERVPFFLRCGVVDCR